MLTCGGGGGGAGWSGGSDPIRREEAGCAWMKMGIARLRSDPAAAHAVLGLAPAHLYPRRRRVRWVGDSDRTHTKPGRMGSLRRGPVSGEPRGLRPAPAHQPPPRWAPARWWCWCASRTHESARLHEHGLANDALPN